VTYGEGPTRAAELVAELEADPALRGRMSALLGVPVGLPEALHGLVAELREQRIASERRFEASDRRFAELRADVNARFEELRSDMNARFAESDRRFEELRSDMNARFAESDRRFEELRSDMKAGFAESDRRFEELRSDMKAGFAEVARRIEQAFRRIDAMGTRWGLQTEAAFREGLRFVIEGRFGAQVERWEHEDREGVVFGHRARVESVEAQVGLDWAADRAGDPFARADGAVAVRVAADVEDAVPAPRLARRR
jgi:hypothetical protein